MTFKQLQQEVKAAGYKGSYIGLTKVRLEEILNELTKQERGITTKELAAVLGITPKTLRRKLRNLQIQKRPERDDRWHYGWNDQEIKLVKELLTA